MVPELIRKFDFELEGPARGRDWEMKNVFLVKVEDLYVQVKRRNENKGKGI